MFLLNVPRGLGNYFLEREDKIYKGHIHAWKSLRHKEEYPYSCLLKETKSTIEEYESYGSFFTDECANLLEKGVVIDDLSSIFNGNGDDATSTVIQGMSYWIIACGSPFNNDEITDAYDTLVFALAANTLGRLGDMLANDDAVYPFLTGRDVPIKFANSDNKNAETVNLFFRLTVNRDEDVDGYVSHDDWIIRHIVAERTRDKKILLQLINDTHPVVKCAAAQNPVADKGMLSVLLLTEEMTDDKIIGDCARKSMKNLIFNEAMSM